jgi:hypothetical protein
LTTLFRDDFYHLVRPTARNVCGADHFFYYRRGGEDAFLLCNSFIFFYFFFTFLIATKRFDAQKGADREVQRILLKLLDQVFFAMTMTMTMMWFVGTIIFGFTSSHHSANFLFSFPLLDMALPLLNYPHRWTGLNKAPTSRSLWRPTVRVHDRSGPLLPRPPRSQFEFPNPDRRQKRMVFQAATSRTYLSDELNLEDDITGRKTY